MKKSLCMACAMLMTASTVGLAASRSETLLEKGWMFTRVDSADFSAKDVDVKTWQKVRVPHDWAIYGPFSWDNDRQNVAIVQDGQKKLWSMPVAQVDCLLSVPDGIARSLLLLIPSATSV